MSRHNDQISALLRLSGDASRPGSKAELAARQTAHAAWQSSLQRRRRRHRWMAATPLLLIAAAALTYRLLSPTAPLAELDSVVGDVAVDAVPHGRIATDASADLAPGSVVQTAPHGQAAFRLTNGSRLRLDSATRVRLTGERRIELQSGALYFDTSLFSDDPGASQVHVHTPLATLVNTGTSYEVRINADHLSIAVRTGSVLVEPTEGASFEVRRGEVARLTSDGTMTTVPVPPLDPRFAWTRPLIEPFHIDGRTLGQFLEWVSRETGWEVRFGAGVSPTIRNARLRGDLQWTSPEQAVEPTLALVGSVARFEGRFLIVEQRGGSNPGG